MAFAWFRSITVPHTNTTQNEVNFPMLFWGPYAWLCSTGYGGHVQQTNGVDIAFYADAAGTQLLDFERVAYDPATGNCEFYVRLPSVSATVDTVIYIMYGDASASDLSNRQRVWDSHYMGVWHFGDGSAVNGADSTSNGNNAVAYGTVGPAASLIGGGRAGQVVGSAVQFGGAVQPANPTCSGVAGGLIAATTYYTRISYVTASGESNASNEVALSAAANTLLQVASPAALTNATGWNVYVSTTSNNETLQNSSPIPIGTAWTEPASGLVTGGAAWPQYVNTSAGGYLYVAPSSSLNLTGPMQLLAYASGAGTSDSVALSKKQSGHGYEFGQQAGSFGIHTFFFIGDSNTVPVGFGNGAGPWNTYDPATGLAHSYIGGNIEVNRSPASWGSAGITSNPTAPLVIGGKSVSAGAAAQNGWPSAIDEVRISNIVRSNNWNVMTYNNISDSFHSFYTVGPEAPLPSAVQPVVYVVIPW